MKIQGTHGNQDHEPPDRYVRYQFWLSDHGHGRVLYSEWSDGSIEAADVMLPDRIVDLQQWDTQNGVILNHLVETGWQPGTVPYGVGDDPIPDILPDYETPCEPARKPVAQKGIRIRPRLWERPRNRLKRLKGQARQRPLCPRWQSNPRAIPYP